MRCRTYDIKSFLKNGLVHPSRINRGEKAPSAKGFEFSAPYWFGAARVPDQTAGGMSSEGWITCHSGQDGYGLLITNYLVTLSLWHCLVEIIPHIYRLEAFSDTDTDFFWVKIWLHRGFRKVLADLENHVAAIQHHTVPKLLYRVNICCRGPACTLLWRPAVLWLERFALSHHSLALPLSLFPFTFCAANHIPCDAFSSDPLSPEK